MATVKVRSMVKALLKKGFEKNNTHHKMFVFVHNGESIGIGTRISHGFKEYGDDLLGQMAKQLHMSKAQLLEFFECSMTEADYIELLAENGDL